MPGLIDAHWHALICSAADGGARRRRVLSPFDRRGSGPGSFPSSMMRFNPNAGPPTSRTVVKPRINVRPCLASGDQMEIGHVGAERLHRRDRADEGVPSARSMSPGMQDAAAARDRHVYVAVA